jgi:8-oxo-dGTP diphosphatase
VKEYVAGLLFSEDRSTVALIHKTHPDWQAGKWNAISGRVEVENQEHPNDAMRREFKEETGLDITTWRQFASLQDGRGWIVRFYWATGDPFKCKQMTDEKPVVAIVGNLPKDLIPNLRWLIPMALSMKDERCDSFVIREVKSRAAVVDERED